MSFIISLLDVLPFSAHLEFENVVELSLELPDLPVLLTDLLSLLILLWPDCSGRGRLHDGHSLC